jgi:hypothetical protein
MAAVHESAIGLLRQILQRKQMSAFRVNLLQNPIATLD